MDGCVLAGCGIFFFIFILLGWLLLHRKRKQPIRRCLVIAECLQPQLKCKPVPCQHPYYRVISEYTEKPIQQHSGRESSEKVQLPKCHKSRNSISSLNGQLGVNSRKSSMTKADSCFTAAN